MYTKTVTFCISETCNVNLYKLNHAKISAMKSTVGAAKTKDNSYEIQVSLLSGLLLIGIVSLAPLLFLFILDHHIMLVLKLYG